MDYDDWGINKAVFQWLESLWGPHSIDRFANSHNRQPERYNSRFYDVGTEWTHLQSIGLGSAIGGVLRSTWCAEC